MGRNVFLGFYYNAPRNVSIENFPAFDLHLDETITASNQPLKFIDSET